MLKFFMEPSMPRKKLYFVRVCRVVTNIWPQHTADGSLWEKLMWFSLNTRLLHDTDSDSYGRLSSSTCESPECWQTQKHICFQLRCFEKINNQCIKHNCEFTWKQQVRHSLQDRERRSVRHPSICDLTCCAPSFHYNLSYEKDNHCIEDFLNANKTYFQIRDHSKTNKRMLRRSRNTLSIWMILLIQQTTEHQWRQKLVNSCVI